MATDARSPDNLDAVDGDGCGATDVVAAGDTVLSEHFAAAVACAATFCSPSPPN